MSGDRLSPASLLTLQNLIARIEAQGGTAEGARLRGEAARKLEESASDKLRDGSLEAAVDDLKAALALDPKAPDVERLLVEALLRSGRRALRDGRRQKAIGLGREATASSAAGPDARVFLGDALASAKNYKAAAVEYESAAAARPDDRKLQRRLQKVRMLAQRTAAAAQTR